jgi:hypothetical protein
MDHSNHMKPATPQFQQTEARCLEMAIDTIRVNAITNKVKIIRADHNLGNSKTAHINQAIVRCMHPSGMVMRIAAAVIIMISSATIYKYASVNSKTLYNQQYLTYELTATRSNSIPDAQAEAYLNAHWREVIALNNNAISRTNKSRFLAAMAEMELNHFPQSLVLLQEIISNHADEAFHEEAEYYSALAFLAVHQEKKGLDMVAEIKANPSHTYYPLACRISAIDLKIIELKR